MKSFELLIEEYELHADLIRSRISILGAGITAAQKNGDTGKAKLLCDRRQTLYFELWEMEGSIRSMCDYLRNLERRGEGRCG